LVVSIGVVTFVILILSIVAYHVGLSSFIRPLRVACINLS
jgi:hypothetical protein